MTMKILTSALFAVLACQTVNAQTAQLAPVPVAPSAVQADEPMPNFEVFLATVNLDNAKVLAVKNISQKLGYDNHPAFFSDNQSLYYISDRSGQNDVFRYDIKTAQTTQITATKEAEYSPVPMPDGSGFSVIRVATPNAQGADSTNPPLWRYNLDGTPGMSLIDVTSIGYYAWIEKKQAALFVVGDAEKKIPNRLVSADISTGKTTDLANSPGRRIARTPDGRVSFVDQSDSKQWVISAIAPGDKSATVLVAMPVSAADEQAPDFSEDYAWLPDGSILMAKGSTLLRWDGKPGSAFVRFADVPNLNGDIKRLVASQDGKHLALVVLMAEKTKVP
ncbi:MAG: PD40 domain-containing protein [Arenimonas sp.]|nr:PD40 domain-containing protein [Arenimonas sp.]